MSLSESLLESEVSPPGWKGTVDAMAGHSGITNPYALAWWMSGQGYSPGGKGKEADIEGAIKAFKKAYPDGAGVVKPDAEEGNSGSSMGQLYRATGKPKESNFSHISSLREAKVSDKDRTIETVIIEEGLGNLGDMHFYTKAALQSAAAVFEGQKIYADHPTRSEETDRPERTVRDNLGYHTELRYEESPQGRGQLFSVVKVLPGDATDWAWQMMVEAVSYARRYPGKSLVGVSINANGDTTEEDIDSFLEAYPWPADPDVKGKVEQAKEQGKNSVFVVSNIKDAVSADMVTEAGAGGKFVKLKESNKRRALQMKKGLQSLLRKAKGGSNVTLNEADIKKLLKEDEGDEPDGDEQAPANTGDNMGAKGDGTTVHIHASEKTEDETEGKGCEDEQESEEEADDAMMATYGRYVSNGGKMSHKEWKKEHERGMKASKQGESKKEDENEKKQTESKRLLRLEAENASLRENVRKIGIKQCIKDLLMEAGFPEAIEAKIMPLLERAKDEAQVKEIVDEWTETMKSLESERMETGPGKSSSLRETNNNDLFAGCAR